MRAVNDTLFFRVDSVFYSKNSTSVNQHSPDPHDCRLADKIIAGIIMGKESISLKIRGGEVIKCMTPVQ